ncbi:YgfZ/GcvT domain-containing protein [Halorhodospira halophila]|uniref:Glycine cleavage T protein (Aminomethyl transferase) n=1 Tax=Halorhodospira halophila (strain DSM 244 / SL1) TaxID=349124 RepID=A1WT30_HALHL|nr:folate-binding protein YgfZ [Halorhodospira halophila]ABM60842.1 glycine cleavage T protein (aminomethyl transferase) [Halorhodospira halophila SL1]MBK1728497.1 folate-binding protein [Halorhodospira halophila]
MPQEFPAPPDSAETPSAQADCYHAGAGYAVVAVTGDEAQDFLQRILTADIPPPAAKHSVLAGLCTPKGRLLALARLIPWDDGYRLVLPDDVAGATVSRLQMYVLRSRVTVAPPTPDWRLVRAAGPGARAVLAERCGHPLPEVDGGVSHSADMAIVRMPGTPERYCAVGPASPVQALEHALAEYLPSADTAAWRAIEIRAGQPEIRAPGRELFIPQMVNLDRLGGVSFSKGCFPGQEVVARTHYRGKVKQRMFRAAGTGPAPADGCEIRDAEGQLAGHIVCAAEVPEGFVALASLREAQLETAPLSADGQRLRLSEAGA